MEPKQKKLSLSKKGLEITNDSVKSQTTLKKRPQRGYRGENQTFADDISGGESVSEEELEPKLVDQDQGSEEAEVDELEVDELEEDDAIEVVEISDEDSKKQQPEQNNAQASGSGINHNDFLIPESPILDLDNYEDEWGSPISETPLSSNIKPQAQSAAPPSPPTPPFLTSSSFAKFSTPIVVNEEEEVEVLNDTVKELVEKAIQVESVSAENDQEDAEMEAVEEEEEEEEEEVVARRSAKKGKNVIREMDIDEEEHSPIEKLPSNNLRPTALQSSRSHLRLLTPNHSQNTTNSDEELMGTATFAVIIPSPRKRSTKVVKVAKPIASITIPDTEDEDEDDDLPIRPIISSSKKGKQYGKLNPSNSNKRAGSVLIIDSEDDSDDVQPQKKRLPFPSSTLKKNPSASKRIRVPSSSSSSSSEEDQPSPPKRKVISNPTKKAKRVEPSSSASPSPPPPSHYKKASTSKPTITTTTVVATTSKSVKRKPKLHIVKPQAQRYSSGDDSFSSDSDKPSSKRKKAAAATTKTIKKRTTTTSSPRKKLAPSQKLSNIVKKAKARESADEDSSDPDDFIDDDFESLLGSRDKSRSPKGKGKEKEKKKKKQDKSTSNDKDKKMSSKKDVKGKGKARRIVSTSEEEDDGELSSDGENDHFAFEEEDLDLAIPDKKTVRIDRLRNVKKESKYDKLRAMRDKKSGASSQPKFLGDDREENEDDSESSSSSSSSSGSDNQGLDENLLEFIVSEDEEDEDNVKIVNAYREEISNQAQGLKFYLKTYIQWIIREIVCPEIEWLKEKSYNEAYDQCTKAFKGLVNSLIASSAWKKPFKRALDNLPKFVLSDLPDSLKGVQCDACTQGRSRHSTYKLELGGDQYDPKNFKTTEGFSDDEEEDSDSDVSDKDEFVREFNLGTNCAGRAEAYSELNHFGWLIYDELFGILAGKRKIFPKLLLPNTSTKKQKADEETRRAQLNEKEAERCTNLLEKDGTVTKIADEWLRKMTKATSDFADQKS